MVTNVDVTRIFNVSSTESNTLLFIIFFQIDKLSGQAGEQEANLKEQEEEVNRVERGCDQPARPVPAHRGGRSAGR